MLRSLVFHFTSVIYNVSPITAFEMLDIARTCEFTICFYLFGILKIEYQPTNYTASRGGIPCFEQAIIAEIEISSFPPASITPF